MMPAAFEAQTEYDLASEFSDMNETVSYFDMPAHIIEDSVIFESPWQKKSRGGKVRKISQLRLKAEKPRLKASARKAKISAMK